MRSYIKTYEEEEKRAEVLAEMDKLIFISQCHFKSKRYPEIKQWFLNKYPEVKKFGETESEEASAEEETAEVIETVVKPAKVNANVESVLN